MEVLRRLEILLILAFAASIALAGAEAKIGDVDVSTEGGHDTHNFQLQREAAREVKVEGVSHDDMIARVRLSDVDIGDQTQPTKKNNNQMPNNQNSPPANCNVCPSSAGHGSIIVSGARNISLLQWTLVCMLLLTLFATGSEENNNHGFGVLEKA